MGTNANDVTELAVLLAINAKDHKHDLDRSGPMHRYAIQDAKAIIRAARTIRRWSEAQCNGIPRYDVKIGRVVQTWTDVDDAKSDKAFEKASSAIRTILLQYKLERGPDALRFQRDPRGHVVKVRFVEGAYWGH